MWEEDIQYDRFPSEIIADEYLHTDNKDGSVYIFSDDNHAGNILKVTKDALVSFGFDIRSGNQFPIEAREQVLDAIKEIANEDHSKNTCFILLFFGTIKGKNQEEYITDSGDTIHGTEVWRTVMTCKTLKYRPKIFIFHGFKEVSSEQSDAGRYRRADEPPKYDIPAESDILVMYKVTEAGVADSTYFRNLWKNIEDFGARDDLMNIIAYTERDGADERYPITVSTLRKKFYVKPSDFRQHWYDIARDEKKMLNAIETITSLRITLNVAGNGSNCGDNTNTNETGVDGTHSQGGRCQKGKMTTSATGTLGRRPYSHVQSKVNSFRRPKSVLLKQSSSPM